MIAVFDVRGAHVLTLVDRPAEAGPYSVTWDGLDAGGTPVSSGAYFVKAQCGGDTETQKLTLLK
jgi:flagellar hook assembly protein FlgD